MNKLRNILLFLLGFTTFSVFAGEGMWLPLLLKALNESEMKSMGMKMSADDIYSVNKGSLKDAIVHFGGFCTGEIISDQGLVLTNHHCGYNAIQSHSSLEHNYLKDGYWAKNQTEELPTPGLFVTFIVRIVDVTEKVLMGLDPLMDPKSRQQIIETNAQTIQKTFTKETYQDIQIRPFFEGNQYFLFVTETYNDVRFVGAPPESVGKFGADTDNWVWPRHTGDFSLFRIYAGPDNLPAEYSPNNKPLKPKHSLPISLDGVEDGDFTMVFGFPGRTYQYLPSFAVKQTAEIVDPARVGVRDISLGVMDKHMRKDADAKLAYSVKFAGLANSWKKWKGEMIGLKSKNAVGVKELEEQDFTKRLDKNPDLKNKYSNLLPELKQLYSEMDPVIKNRTLFAEFTGGSNIELFKIASYADRLVKAFKENGETGFASAVQRVEPLLSQFYKDYRPSIDKEIVTSLYPFLSQEITSEYEPDIPMADKVDWIDNVYDKTNLTSNTKFLEAIGKGGAGFSQIISADPAYQFYLSMRKPLDEKLSPEYNRLNDRISDLQQKYLAALMETYPEQRFWPDANSTLRVTYGQVEPYSPRDGVEYKTVTYLDGILEKYIPGDYEFDVDPKLIDLYYRKDYGQYGDDGKLPVCFIASNHTTGGNSGSPAIDANGNLIGLNFDRVWEGTMSDIFYDRSICRNIMVDARYILFVVDKMCGAGHLVNEMKLVHPKKKK